MRVEKFMKRQQQGLDVPNSDSVKPAKLFIPDKYKSKTEPNKLKRIKYFNKALLETRAWGFSEEETRICANITAAVDNMIVWHKALPTYK